MAQTSVEWLVEKLKIYLPSIHHKGLEDIFTQSKEMHKKETIRFIKTMPAYIDIGKEGGFYVKYDAEAHYNETFNK
jgi:hypothetical protein